jgi:acetate kinase
MNQGILTINAGSSSIKFALFPLAHPISPDAEVSGQIDGIGTSATKLLAKDKSGKRSPIRPSSEKTSATTRLLMRC